MVLLTTPIARHSIFRMLAGYSRGAKFYSEQQAHRVTASLQPLPQSPVTFSCFFHGNRHHLSQVIEKMVGAAGIEPATPPV